MALFTKYVLLRLKDSTPLLVTFPVPKVPVVAPPPICKVPVLMMVSPLYVLVPESVKVPMPALVSEPVPMTLPLAELEPVLVIVTPDPLVFMASKKDT